MKVRRVKKDDYEICSFCGKEPEYVIDVDIAKFSCCGEYICHVAMCKNCKKELTEALLNLEFGGDTVEDKDKLIECLVERIEETENYRREAVVCAIAILKEVVTNIDSKGRMPQHSYDYIKEKADRLLQICKVGY